MWAVPTHYLGLLLLSGRPSLAGQAAFCVLVSNGPIPPLNGVGIQLILRLPFGLQNTNICWGSGWPAEGFRAERDGEEVRRGREGRRVN